MKMDLAIRARQRISELLAADRARIRARGSRTSNLWILPTTSTNAANGFTYDVVNRKGEVFERVQLPRGHVLAALARTILST
jgi:hypothetical protein